MAMKFATVCSGIGAALVAWKELGWECEFTSEIEPFAAKVLNERHQCYNYRDMRDINHEGQELDLLAGGTPCQEFSLAGWRRGLDGARGNLALQFCRLVGEFRPTWVVYENVTGILSSNKGRDFASILGAMEELGYGFGWRVLDAQYFGVPQRRKRVFCVGYLGDWRPAGAVLFDRHSFERHSAPSRPYESKHAVNTLRGAQLDYFRLQGFGNYSESLVSGPIKARDYKSPTDLVTEVQYVDNQPVCSARRLTIRELERLQGFPDDYTAIAWKRKPAERCPHEPRYRVLGNSMAVPVIKYIGERINYVSKMVSDGSHYGNAVGPG